MFYKEEGERIRDNNYNKEQIVKNNLGECVDNKGVAELSYYNELGFDLQALDECICMRDLRDLANINKIPEIARDGKIYSTFARIRRPVRKHICFPWAQASSRPAIYDVHILPCCPRYSRCTVSIYPQTR